MSDPQHPRVLVVDDDPVVLESLAEELGVHFTVTRAGSGEEALARLQTDHFDALVSDVRMPGMGGVQLVERAKSIDPALVRVFLTGYADEEVYESARESGAFKLTKPWGDELELVLRHAIEHRHMLERMETELHGYVSVADEAGPANDEVSVADVLGNLRRSLDALSWVEEVVIQPVVPQGGGSLPPPSSRWFETGRPMLLPGSLDRFEQWACLGSTAATRHRVWVRWVGADPHAERVVELALRQAADALRMRELNDEARRRARQLEAARQEMMEKERLSALGAMAASVAHDIRSPLGVLLMNQEYLMELLEERGEEGGELSAVLEDSTLALEMIQKVLDSLKAFAMEPNHTESAKADVRDAIDRTGRMLRQRLSAAHVTLEVSVEGRPRTQVASGEVEQILMNLVGNAIEASPSGATISVRAEEAHGNVRVWVEDRGEGLSKEAADLLFRPFHTTKDGGMGLGLAISRQMARHHGGDVRLERSAPGKGACFELSFPAAR